MAKLPIQERFVSLQGEGLLAGTPSSFIRVAGCNLRCVWCDSPATSWQPTGVQTPVSELVDYCAGGPRHVVLTGGEPMLFSAIAELSEALRAHGHHVTIETAGTVWLQALQCDLLSCSPKLAHSTPWQRAPEWAERHEKRRWQPDLVRRLLDRYSWQLKFVVRSEDSAALDEDLEHIESMLAALRLAPETREQVLLMPECIDPDQLARQYRALAPICTQRGFRLGQRLHIAIFGHTPGT